MVVKKKETTEKERQYVYKKNGETQRATFRKPQNKKGIKHNKYNQNPKGHNQASHFEISYKIKVILFQH